MLFDYLKRMFVEPEDLLSGDGDAPQGAESDGTEERATTTVLLFRAASHAEFSDVTTPGIFRQGPNTYATGKFFAESGGDAMQWGSVLE